MSAEATLMQIAESAGSLLKLVEAKQPIADREVKMLQTALSFVLSSNDALNRTKKAQQCVNMIDRLAKYTRSVPSSATGDTDDVLPLGFDQNGAPTQKATKYIEKTIDLLGGKGGKGGGGAKKNAAPAAVVPAVAVEEAAASGGADSSTGTSPSLSAAAATSTSPALSAASVATTAAAVGSSANMKVAKKNKKKTRALALASPDTLKPQWGQNSGLVPTPIPTDSDEDDDESPADIATPTEPTAADDVGNKTTSSSASNKTSSSSASAAANGGDKSATAGSNSNSNSKKSRRKAQEEAEAEEAQKDFILNASITYAASEKEKRRQQQQQQQQQVSSSLKGASGAAKPNKVVQLLEPILSVGKKKDANTNNANDSKNNSTASSNGGGVSKGALKTQKHNALHSKKGNRSGNASTNASFAGGDVLKSVPKQVQWRWSNIPVQRRLQTLVVSILTFFTGLPFFVFLFFFLMCFKYTAPLMIIYLLYIFVVFPRTMKWPIEGKKWWRQSWIFEQYRDYFPIRLVVPKSIRKQFDPKGNYFFIYHPHGIHSFGAVVCFGADVHGVGSMLPGIKFHVQTLGAQFWAPFWREMVIWAGSGDASAKCIKQTLNAGPGQSPVLVVGGAEESLLSSPKTNVLCLMKRKGFVRIALETGKPLVPVFAFGETNVYYNYAHHIPRLKNFLLKMQKKTKFALPIIVGRGYFNYSFGMLPHRRPINVVVGEPLIVPHIAKPTPEEIDFWHSQYVEALMAHYETHKGVYDPEGSLVIS